MVLRMPRPYPKEFREGALALVRQGDRSIPEIARELSIAESCLRNWVKRDQLDRGERDDGRARRAQTPATRERATQAGEGDPEKSGRLLRPGRDPVSAF